MMEISVNGSIRQVQDAASLPDILTALNYNKAQIAIWVNGRQLLQQEYGQYRFSAGDQVRIVRIFGGG